ncbi:hypothetical protein J7E50_12660 [Pedobacter sp. ISL-68]|uniref:hypothetical protein n=1 Tax=unclassified Pedobacter TaxID=2628915 RepID=UPI001BE7F41A|nr:MULTISPECIES: hypothetical protein [unclassified Pedobacter]MBT2561689.1 hypothetical protein [Pedobacter sp. ISL-64]MBT2591077.1 hypothetical protein [Pedobacter sp. ISL-68]
MSVRIINGKVGYFRENGCTFSYQTEVQLTVTFIDLFGDPNTQLTRQKVKDYIRESTYKT